MFSFFKDNNFITLPTPFPNKGRAGDGLFAKGVKYPFKDSQTRKYYKIDFYKSDDQKFHADLSQIPSGIYVLEFKKLREDLWGGDLYQ
ncbi:MAG: hypothetical protein IPJ43_09930 [Saprospiraceae bacterium]|nr:hypothetical protein [Saprospiraceae bacterium]